MKTASRTRVALAAGAAVLMLARAPLAMAQEQPASAYSGARIDGKTEVEKAIGRCAAAVIGGALLGALAGGNQRRGEGAALGAAIGAGVCAAMLSVASKRDKEYVRQLQLQAVNTGEQQTMTWQTSDGRAASATVTASNVVQVSSPKTSEVLNCRRANTQLTVQGEDSATSDVVCLQGDTWVTLDKLKNLGIKPADVLV